MQIYLIQRLLKDGLVGRFNPGLSINNLRLFHFDWNYFEFIDQFWGALIILLDFLIHEKIFTEVIFLALFIS